MEVDGASQEVPPRKQLFRCQLCKDKNVEFTSRRELFIHQTNCHFLEQIGGAEQLQEFPFNEENGTAPWQQPQFSEDICSHHMCSTRIKEGYLLVSTPHIMNRISSCCHTVEGTSSFGLNITSYQLYFIHFDCFFLRNIKQFTGIKMLLWINVALFIKISWNQYVNFKSIHDSKMIYFSYLNATFQFEYIFIWM